MLCLTGIEHKVIYCIIGNHFFFLEILGIINVNIATNTYYIVLIIYFKILILPVDACIILIIISIAMTKSINYEGSHGAPDKNEMIFIGLLFCYSFFDYVIQPCFYCLMQNGCLYGLVVRLVSFGGLDIFIILIYVEGFPTNAPTDITAKVIQVNWPNAKLSKNDINAPQISGARHLASAVKLNVVPFIKALYFGGDALWINTITCGVDVEDAKVRIPELRYKRVFVKCCGDFGL